MSTQSPPQQPPIKTRPGRKSDVRTQFSALCFRETDGGPEVCLITSRGTGRWILPKGWPMHKQTPADAAATEAWEEAGLTGEVFDRCLGVYSYIKPLDKTRTPVIALVYPVRVLQEHDDWPERSERQRRWFSLQKASRKVDEPALRHILATFDPAVLAG